MSAARLFRQTMTVARRDFVATVMAPTFLLFLLAPLLMVSFGAVGSLGARSVKGSTDAKERLYALVDPALHSRFRAADAELRGFVSGPSAPPELVLAAPEADPEAQARRLLAEDAIDVPAVLFGTLEAPQLIHVKESMSGARYLAVLDEAVARGVRAGIDRPITTPRFTRVARESTSIGGKGAAALLSVVALFVLTLMLASQVVGTMAEERSNKVIEVLAAAVPLEAVFLGKLVGMFGVALLFVGFWGAIFAAIPAMMPASFNGFASIAPAVGMPAFPLLFLAYFATAYLLLGAVFLGVGAQAATPREIQMLSLPITIFQMAMLGLALAVAGKPGSNLALFAELFPFSSPFAMAAHAANQRELWPHFAAIAWQLLWVAISVTIGARAFRRGVLQSSGPKLRWLKMFGGSKAAKG